jgi:hypothetical protein
MQPETLKSLIETTLRYGGVVSIQPDGSVIMEGLTSTHADTHTGSHVDVAAQPRAVPTPEPEPEPEPEPDPDPKSSARSAPPSGVPNRTAKHLKSYQDATKLFGEHAIAKKSACGILAAMHLNVDIVPKWPTVLQFARDEVDLSRLDTVARRGVEWSRIIHAAYQTPCSTSALIAAMYIHAASDIRGEVVPMPPSNLLLISDMSKNYDMSRPSLATRRKFIDELLQAWANHARKR